MTEHAPVLVLQAVILLLVLCLGWSVHLMLAMRNAVPYVTAPPMALPQILEALRLPEHGRLWDLGCGDGRVLKAARAKRPQLKLSGVDNNPMPLQLARLSLGKKVNLVKGDILGVDLKDADRVFCYLGPGLMRDLEPKFLQELPKHARVVSMQFPLPNRKPDAEITLKHGKPYAAKLYVYDY